MQGSRHRRLSGRLKLRTSGTSSISQLQSARHTAGDSFSINTYRRFVRCRLSVRAKRFSTEYRKGKARSALVASGLRTHQWTVPPDQVLGVRVELRAVPRVFTRLLGTFHRALIALPIEDCEFVDLVGAAIIADRVGSVATKHWANLPHKLCRRHIELLAVDVVDALIANIRRVQARHFLHFVVGPNDSDTRDAVLALELEGFFQDRWHPAAVTSGKGAHQWANRPNGLSTFAIELTAVDFILRFVKARNPRPLRGRKANAEKRVQRRRQRRRQRSSLRLLTSIDRIDVCTDPTAVGLTS